MKTVRITLITRRIATQRAGARLKVRKHDVRMALAGVDTLDTPLPPEERGAGR